MIAVPFEGTQDVRAALAEIVAERGPSALSDPATLSNLLKDLLPDAPGVARLLVAAAEDRLAETLRDHLAQGMDATTATRLAASAFAASTVFTPEICIWVTSEIAAALGMTEEGAEPQLSVEAQLAATPAALPATSGEAETKAAWLAGTETVRPEPEPTRTVSGTDGVGSETVGQDSVATSRAGQDAAGWFGTGRTRKAVGAAIAVLGLAGGIIAWAPWHSSPPLGVQPPVGLSEAGRTWSSITLTWAAAARGPQPGSYEIYQDGSPVGSVGGSATTYRVDGLIPSGIYSFRVRALKGKLHSALSAPLDARTAAAPPLSAAVLTGPWTVRYSHLRWSGLTRAPALRSDSWTFSPLCRSGPCSVRLNGAAQAIPFHVILRRSGLVYTGTAALKGYFRCSSVPTNGTVAVRVHISQASAASGWQASSWTGQITLSVPVTSCTASQITATVSGNG